MSFLSKQDICGKTSVSSRGEFPNNLRGVRTIPLPAAAKYRHKYTCSIHPGWRKSHNRHILHLPTHYSPADTMHSAGHVCCHYTPLSLLIEGWGTVKALSSVHQKRTTDNFAFEGLNMHERPKRVRARGRTIVWPPPLPFPTPWCTHTYMKTLPSSNRWEDVSKCEQWVPPPLVYHPHSWGQLGGRHSFFSAFRGKQKSVWDPSYTHVHVWRHMQPPPTPKNTVNATVGLIQFQ